MQHTGLQSIIHNAKFLIGGQGVNVLSRALYAIVLARYLGPELYGMLNYGFSWYLTLLPATILGLDVLMSREIGKNRQAGIDTASQVFTVRLIVTTLISVLSILVALLVESDSDAKLLIIILTFALFGRSIFVWAKGAFTAMESTKHSFQLDALLRPTEVALGVAVLILGGGVIEVALVHTLSWWAQGVLSLRAIHKLEPRIKPRYDPDAIKHIFEHAAPLAISSILFIWFVQGPIMMYRSIYGISPELGQLTLIIQVFIILSSIPNSIGNAALPILTRALLREDGKANIFIDGMIRIGILFTGALSIVLIAYGADLVTLIFGDKYISAGKLLGFIIMVLIPYCCATTLYRFHLAEGQYLETAIVTSIGALSFTALFYPLTSLYGAAGVIAAMGIGQTVWAILFILLHTRTHSIDIKRCLFNPIALLTASFGAYYTLAGFSKIIACAFTIAMLITGVFLLKIIRKEELAALMSKTKNILTNFRNQG